MSRKTQQSIRFALSRRGFAFPKMSVLLTSFHQPLAGMSDTLPGEPYSVFIAKITK